MAYGEKEGSSERGKRSGCSDGEEGRTGASEEAHEEAPEGNRAVRRQGAVGREEGRGFVYSVESKAARLILVALLFAGACWVALLGGNN
jgi:hypothetical protein